MDELSQIEQSNKELLPRLRKDLLKLECSKEIFDREIAKLVVYLHDRIFKIEK